MSVHFRASCERLARSTRHLQPLLLGCQQAPGPACAPPPPHTHRRSVAALQHHLVREQQLELAAGVRDEQRQAGLLRQQVKAQGVQEARQVL